MSTPIPRRRSGAFALFVTILLTGLAGGALCCLLALLIKQDPVWLLLPIAPAIGAFVRWQGFAGARAALAAASAMLICSMYAEYLYAAVRMADMLGFPLRDTFFKMDWRLAWQIVRSSFSVGDGLILLVSLVAAVGIAARGTR